MKSNSELIKSEIDEKISSLVKLALESKHAKKTFILGESTIPVTGKVFGGNLLRQPAFIVHPESSW
jgi:hypothetical protein